MIEAVLPYAVVGTWVALGVYAVVRHGRAFVRQLVAELRGPRGDR